jgi:hypothetical protein
MDNQNKNLIDLKEEEYDPNKPNDFLEISNKYIYNNFFINFNK